MGAWMYDEHYANTDFNYEDIEKKYENAQNATTSSPEEIKAKLDEAHK